MGLRGASPTPTAILKLRGSWRGELNKGEPQPKRGRPVIPNTLTKPQATIWRQLMTILDDMGLLTKADPFQLERYCVMFLQWRECQAFIAKNGFTYAVKADEPNCYVGQLPNGEYIVGFLPYPQVKEARQLDHSLKQIEACFGLTPSARSRITLDTAPKVIDPLEDFLNETGG